MRKSSLSLSNTHPLITIFKFLSLNFQKVVERNPNLGEAPKSTIDQVSYSLTEALKNNTARITLTRHKMNILNRWKVIHWLLSRGEMPNLEIDSVGTIANQIKGLHRKNSMINNFLTNNIQFGSIFVTSYPLSNLYQLCFV